MMVVMASADCLRQILDIRELAALGSIGKVGAELVELAGQRGIAVGLGRLRGTLQVCGDLLRDLLILGRVGLLKLLERAHQLSKGRKPAVVGLLHR